MVNVFHKPIDSETSFIETVVSNVPDIKSQKEAMQACGMQPEFAAQLMLMSSAFKSSVILRAGSPPIYNRKRGPKTGLNLTKTSNHGPFKGCLAVEQQFTRVKTDTKGHNHPIGHHSKDAERLKKEIRSKDYQHRMALSLTLPEVLKELGANGDLQVRAYDKDTRQLHLEYKEGRGPTRFNGQFILKLNEGTDEPQFFSRPWDRPELDPNWDEDNKIIKKPASLSSIPDLEYQHYFNQTFSIYYTDSKTHELNESELKPVLVFANTPRTANDFLKAMGENHPSYSKIANLNKLEDILQTLTTKDILDVYNRCGLIVTGDWDGLAIGHPPDINPKYRQVFNTFDIEYSFKNIQGLINECCNYFEELQQQAREVAPENRDAFHQLLLSIPTAGELFTPFALERAGCITPHEFLFQQLLNLNYRQETSVFYHEATSMPVLQDAFNEGMASYRKIKNEFAQQTQAKKQGMLHDITKQATAKYQELLGKDRPVDAWMDLFTEHLGKHLQIAVNTQQTHYKIPHPSYDHNVHDLFQHGFDMRNPYGSNLEGAWLMITPKGTLFYGDTQEQLIEIMLIDNFLKENLIDINHGADMKAGWNKVIKKQLHLGQSIPEKTKEAYLKNQEFHSNGFFKPERRDHLMDLKPGAQIKVK